MFSRIFDAMEDVPADPCLYAARRFAQDAKAVTELFRMLPRETKGRTCRRSDGSYPLVPPLAVALAARLRVFLQPLPRAIRSKASP